jgi:Ca2+/H+ antiporter, TMEM165/GDT1 family
MCCRTEAPLATCRGHLGAVAALAIAGGRSLLRVIPVTWISRVAAVIMLALGGISLAAALS